MCLSTLGESTAPAVPSAGRLSSLLTLTHPTLKCYFFQRSHPRVPPADSTLPTQHPWPLPPFCSRINSSRNATLESSRANSEELKPILVMLLPHPALRCGQGGRSGLMTGDRSARSFHELWGADPFPCSWAPPGLSVVTAAAPAILGPRGRGQTQGQSWQGGCGNSPGLP